ncbi:hypothetical protein NDU88_002186 [Pleurodeles waltl]|uniref:Uncharacterized protein n=1 Tax=Pleurodeles waltl TaxID=8319 RepID=A0AAV7LD43_PLEWA|nr:hypothetical protein NDU88_002186 [Pleurodeles waltl]
MRREGAALQPCPPRISDASRRSRTAANADAEAARAEGRGTQESGTTLLTSTSGEDQTTTESSLGGATSEKTFKEVAPQPDDGGLIGSDSCTMVRRKEKDPPISQEGPPAQQYATARQGGDLCNIKPTRGSADVQNISQSLGEGDKDNEKEMKILDWAKDTGDKFYSLTEESDFSSADEHSPSDSGSSISSERGNASSSNEHTVRQRRRQRKCTKTRSGSQEGTEFSASSGSNTLKWDYSSINLTDVTRTTDMSTMGGQQLVNKDRGENNGGTKSDICAASTDSGMLQSIFNSIKEFQTETRIESRRARVAVKRLQGTVRKVTKSCIEMEAKLCTMDESIVVAEEDVDTLKQQNATQESQMTDIMWKLEDFENQQRRNNLRFLGIEEGLEGNNIRSYMIKLLQLTKVTNKFRLYTIVFSTLRSGDILPNPFSTLDKQVLVVRRPIFHKPV